MQYLSEKVVAINKKLFSTLELIRPAVEDGENMLVLREVEFKTNVYNHPVKGKTTVRKFEKVRQTPKYCVTESEWQKLPDYNTENIAVDIHA